MRKSPYEYYRTLELPYGAEREEVQRAFRRLAKLHHPDRQRGEGDGGARFREVVEAYEFLKGYVPTPQEKRAAHGAAHPIWGDIHGEGLRQMRARKIRIYPRRGPRDRDDRRRRRSRYAAEEGEEDQPRPRLFRSPTLFVRRPTSKEHYWIYLFYIGSIGFVILMALGEVVLDFWNREPEPPAKPPTYSKEQKEQMLRAYMEGVHAQQKADRTW